MFVSLPKVFQSMGAAGGVIGTIFFLMVSFAAITSSVSVMESIVSCMIDKFHISRKKSTVIVTVYACLVGIIVCLGYNALYFELKLPNGATAQILDVMDFISNNLLMPLVALLSCILIGWVVKPQVIIDEVTLGGYKFGRKKAVYRHGEVYCTRAPCRTAAAVVRYFKRLITAIPDCYVLCTHAIFKNIRNPLIFLRKIATTYVFGESRDQKSMFSGGFSRKHAFFVPVCTYF